MRMLASGPPLAIADVVKISLVYNPTAGGGQTKDDLVQLLTAAGHTVRARSSKNNWQKLLQDPGDVVVAAGGDGTVRKVALAAAGSEVPFAILSFGTANNIGKTLGHVGETRELVDAWDAALERSLPFDLGVAAADWGEERFVEAVGGGWLADLLASEKTIAHPTALLGRETDRALHVLAELLEQATPEIWGVTADGSDRSGEYLAVELLNVAFAGPNIPLAADASPTDGLLDLVLIGPDDREPILRYLRSRLETATCEMPALTRMRVNEVELHAPPGVRLRIDDRNWPDEAPLEDGARVRARVLAGAARLLGGPNASWASGSSPMSFPVQPSPAARGPAPPSR
jgi:diacylglycerol kinase (ATP)